MTPQQIQENLQFKSRCILNFENIDPNTPVYRVYPIDRVLELFTQRKNTLVKPNLWDDPFENIVFQQTALLQNGQRVYFSNIRERYYGQCWTLSTDETDALWRIYSPDKKGVRVKTTFGKLWDSYYNPNYQWASIAFFIGKIQYETVNEIKTFLENPDNLEMIFDTSGAGSIQTLLIKRMEFQHENEIRLVYAANNETDDLTKKIYQYDIDPIDLIDELLFDPRFDDVDDFVSRQAEINAFGFTKTINKSTMYQLPNFNLRLNH
jgi:hypothetical protein